MVINSRAANGVRRGFLLVVSLVGIAAFGLVGVLNVGLGSLLVAHSDTERVALNHEAVSEHAISAPTTAMELAGTRSARTPIRVLIRQVRADPRCARTGRVPIPVMITCRSNK